MTRFAVDRPSLLARENIARNVSRLLREYVSNRALSEKQRAYLHEAKPFLDELCLGVGVTVQMESRIFGAAVVETDVLDASLSYARRAMAAMNLDLGAAGVRTTLTQYRADLAKLASEGDEVDIAEVTSIATFFDKYREAMGRYRFA